MSKCHWIISTGTGMALLLTSCATNRPKTQSVPPPQAFAQPVVPAKPLTIPPVKITGMISTTDSKARLMPVAVASDRDPFAATAMPTALRATIQPVRATTIATKSSIVATQPIASLPQPTISLNPTPLPPTSVPVSPAQPVILPPMPPALRLADAIALTGVMQTGSKLSAIVKDTDGTSRYVQTGESLAGGQVIVKQINLNPAGNPSIVLLHNGVEFTRTVGSVAQAL